MVRQTSKLKATTFAKVFDIELDNKKRREDSLGVGLYVEG